MIELEKISRNYSSGDDVVHALVEVDLHIEAGEYRSILGPSGSGKSTLMHILGCLDRPSSGCYQLEGADVSSLNNNQWPARLG